jgi:tRNA nucleotidyltransferase/poly(A) polymerase
MSDYMFMLENHLNAEQFRLVAALQAACDESNINVFLAGGAMRDMLGGFPIRDLDFVIEGNSLKIAKQLSAKTGAKLVFIDENRRAAELVLPNGDTASVSMSRTEKYAKSGAKPRIAQATIHEDLRCRDFTIDSIALSLGRASRGLLLDPTNGLADLERRELRAVHYYVLYDDPIRLWRLIRLKVRLGFTIEERTVQQYQNARESGVERLIPAYALLEQLRLIAKEPNPAETLKALDEEKLLAPIAGFLSGSKLNLPGFAKLLKARQMVPFGIEFRVSPFPLFLFLFTERLTTKERAALLKTLGIKRQDTEAIAKMETRSRKLEHALKSAKLTKASQIYELLSPELGEHILFLFLRTGQRLIQDRIRNYLQKYLPAASEITDKEIEAEGFKPGTPKFSRRKAERIATRLDTRVRKPAPAPEPEVAVAGAGRRPS